MGRHPCKDILSSLYSTIHYTTDNCNIRDGLKGVFMNAGKMIVGAGLLAVQVIMVLIVIDIVMALIRDVF